MEFTVAEIVQYFEEKKKGTFTCVFCGNQHFNIGMGVGLHAGDPGILTTPMMPPPGIVEPGYHAFVAIICTNCGRTDFFHVNHLNTWKHTKSLAGGGT